MNDAVLNITNLFLWLMTVASFLVIFYGGVKYFLAKENKEKKNRAGKIFICGLTVLLITVFLFIILTVVTPSPFGETIL